MKSLNHALPFSHKWLPIVLLFGMIVRSDAQDGTLKDTIYANQLIEEAISLKNQERFEEALLKLDSAEQMLALTLGEQSEKTGAVVRQKALIYEYQFQYDTAIVLYKKAISIQTNALGAEHPIVAKTYADIGICFQSNSDYTNGEEYLTKALKIFEISFGPESEEASVVYKNLGVNKYLRGNYSQAIEFFKKCLSIESGLENYSPIDIAQTIDNIGACYYLKGDYDQGIEYIKKSLAIRLNMLGPDNPYVAQSYSNLASCFFGNGDFERAIDLYKRSIAIIIKALGEEHPFLTGAYNNLGSCYYILADYDRGIEYIEKALAIRLKILDPDHPDVAGAIENLGNCYNGKGDFAKARELYEKSLASGIKTLGSDHPYVAQSYFNLGECFLKMDDFQNAEKNFTKGLSIWENSLGTNHPSIAQGYNRLAECFKQKGDYNQALIYFEKALEANNYKKEAPIAPLSFEFLIYSLQSIANIRLKESPKNDFTQSISLFNDSRLALSAFRKSLLSRGSKERISDKFLSVFEGSISANLLHFQESGDPSALREIFSISEQNKAIGLYESMMESNARKFAETDTSKLEQERELQIAIANFGRMVSEEENKASGERNDSLLLFYEEQVFDKQQQLDSLIAFLEFQFPQYKQAKYDISTISLDKVQNEVLTQGQTLLEYFVGDSSIFIFVVKKDDYRVVEVEKDFPLKEWVEQMRAGIQIREKKKAKESEIIKGLQTYSDAAAKLYQKLIAPVSPFLTDTLLIVPDGELGYLPFEALLSTPPKDVSNCRQYPFLIRTKTISYAPSSTLLAQMMAPHRGEIPERVFLGMGPFSDTSRLSTPDELEAFTTRDTLAPLYDFEVTESTALFGGDKITGSYATAGRFREIAGNYRIMLLSTHGKADKNIGDHSWLAFATEDGAYQRLYVRDLYALSLHADMVVLSACETGYGELRRGEGIVGMARAFIYAGAKSLFVTLWSVEDRATGELTVEFFRQSLMPGMTKTAALKKAKLKLLDEDDTAHPYFWAGMIGIGDMRPVDWKN